MVGFIGLCIAVISLLLGGLAVLVVICSKDDNDDNDDGGGGTELTQIEVDPGEYWIYSNSIW